MPGWFYILRLTSGTLYSGSSRAIQRRIPEHFAGIGSKTTSKDPPVSVALIEEFATHREAQARERQVKRWTRAKKEALIQGDIPQLRMLAKRRKR